MRVRTCHVPSQALPVEVCTRKCSACMISNLMKIEEGLHAFVKADVAHFVGHVCMLKDDRKNIMVWCSMHVASGISVSYTYL